MKVSLKVSLCDFLLQSLVSVGDLVPIIGFIHLSNSVISLSNHEIINQSMGLISQSINYEINEVCIVAAVPQ